MQTLGDMEADDPMVFSTQVSDDEWARTEAINKKKREYEALHTPTYTEAEIAAHEIEADDDEPEYEDD